LRGRRGRRTSSPPQLGQIPFKALAQVAQNVHSKLQMYAVSSSGASGHAQRSQRSRISRAMIVPRYFVSLNNSRPISIRRISDLGRSGLGRR